MNKNNLLVVLLIALIGLSIYFLSLALSNYFMPVPAATAFAEFEPPAEDIPALRQPPVPPTPEEKAARKELRAANIEAGSVGDKLLNFLLSAKMDFSREMYELKYHHFTGRQTPRDSLQQELILLSQIMAAYQTLQIEVVAHTSEIGTWDAQQAITASRAENIKQFLVDQGIASSRITASGYGATYPIADNTSERGRQMNERVEVLIRAL